MLLYHKKLMIQIDTIAGLQQLPDYPFFFVNAIWNHSKSFFHHPDEVYGE